MPHTRCGRCSLPSTRPGVDRKLEEQPVLDVGQRDQTAGERHNALGVVDGQVPRPIGLRRRDRFGGGPRFRAVLILATSSVGENGLTL